MKPFWGKKTTNILSLLTLKDKIDWKFCFISRGCCFFGSSYMVEAERNAEIRYN